MEIRAARTCFAVASFFLLLGGSVCGSGNTSSTTSPPPTAAELGTKYTLSSTDLPGWQVDANDPPQVLEEGTPTDLYSLIDGGSETYTNAGCTVTVYEKLFGTSPQTAVLYSMYMGTNAQATAFFISQKGDLNATDSIPGFDASVAAGYAALVSHTVVAHFGSMFFKLVVSGFDDATLAYPAAAQFLNVLKSKTN